MVKTVVAVEAETLAEVRFMEVLAQRQALGALNVEDFEHALSVRSTSLSDGDTETGDLTGGETITVSNIRLLSEWGEIERLLTQNPATDITRLVHVASLTVKIVRRGDEGARVMAADLAVTMRDSFFHPTEEDHLVWGKYLKVAAERCVELLS